MAREMKDSGIEWIGEIPREWEVTKTLNGLSMPITDGPHTTPELFDDGIAFVSAEAVSSGNGIIDFSHIRGFISQEFYDECCKKYVPEIDDIYMIKSGATTGKVAIVNTLEPVFTIWSPLAVFRSNTNIIWPKYLYYQLQSDGYQKQVQLGWSFGTQQNVGMRVLEQLKITIPPLPEQQSIADFLDTQCAHIDSVIEKTCAAVEEYKKLKQAVITQAVTKGIRPNREMKDSGIEWIGEIPREWRMTKIKVGVSKVGSGKTPSGGAEVYADEGIIFLRSQNIYDTGIVIDSPTFITNETDEEMKNTRVQPNDVLLNITGGSIGRCCIFPNYLKQANVNQHVSIVRVIKTIILSEFMHLYWISDLGKMSIQLFQTGGNREGMTADAIKNSPIAIPDLPEQSEIVAYLDEKTAAIDSLIQKKEQLITELEAYKKSLIYEYVTGKKEVPVHAH